MKSISASNSEGKDEKVKELLEKLHDQPFHRKTRGSTRFSEIRMKRVSAPCFLHVWSSVGLLVSNQLNCIFEFPKNENFPKFSKLQINFGVTFSGENASIDYSASSIACGLFHLRLHASILAYLGRV